MKLKFHKHIDLMFETRTDDEEFEDFDPDWLYLRVIRFVEGDEYDFSKQHLFPTQLIKVNRNKDLVSKIDEIVADMFGIPQERVVILLRKENTSGTEVIPELYNMDWRKPRIISQVSRLDHG